MIKRFFILVVVFNFLAACATPTPISTVAHLPTPSVIPAQSGPTGTPIFISYLSTPTAVSNPTTPTAVPTPTLASESAFIKGVILNNTMYNLNNDSGRLDSPDAKTIIQQYIIPSGANYVGLNPTCWMTDWNSTEIFCKSENDPNVGPAMPDDELVNAIHYLHSVGLRVMLRPDVLPMSFILQSRYGTVGKYWNGTQWEAWFASYTIFISHYAQIAEENHVDLFAVGMEQDDTIQREADWRRVIAAVRSIYHGSLIYSAGAWGDEAWHIKFWDALDYIGIDGYYGMVNKSEPTVAEMEAAWAPKIQAMQDLSKQYGKPILLSEIGARSVQNYSIQWLKGNPDGWNGPYDGQFQANYFTASFEALKNQPWLKGIVIWATETDPLLGGPNDAEYTFFDKPAEQVVHQYFGGTVITPTPSLVEDTTNSMDIYRDNLLNSWTENTDPNSPVVPNLLSTNAHQGSYAIDLPLSKVNMIELDCDCTIDVSKYTWLEFYIMVGKNEPKPLEPWLKPLSVFLGYWVSANNHLISRMVPIDNPVYIEGGQFQPGTWQRIRIPLADFKIGPFFNNMRIFTCPWGCQLDPKVDDVYIDDIRLT